MATTITNLIANPSYETNTTGWTGQAGSTITRVTTDAASGSACLRVVTTGSGANQGIVSASGVQAVPVAQGQTRTISVALKGTGTMRLQCLEYTAANASIGGAVSESAVFALTGDWVRHSLTRTATGAAAAYLRLFISTNVAQALTFYVDAWLGQDGDTATAYFDGDSPGAVWTGTAHASTSVLTLSTARTYPVLQIGSSHVGPLRVGKG